MRALTRDIDSLGKREFDLLVIGGGINGAGIAWDAALRGLSVALIERADFGGATSSGCFKIIHGGLRYLQHLDLKRVRESVREQRILRTIAPHLVSPLPFLVPCYGRGRKGREFLSLGLLLYEFVVACDRNRNLGVHHQLSRFRRLDSQQCLRHAPGLKAEGLTGGVLYEDVQLSNCERFTFAVVASAREAGAVVANYCEAVQLNASQAESGEGRIESVTAHDLFRGTELQIKARFVVNATGPWVDQVIARTMNAQASAEQAAPVRFSKGIQCVVPLACERLALALESSERDEDAIFSRGGRSYFITPWREHSLIGTTDELFTDSPDRFSITKSEVDALIKTVSKLYRSEALSTEQVTHVFGGLRPLASDVTSAVARDDQIIDSPCTNLLSVNGVKYTTFRLLAERVVNLVSTRLAVRRSRCLTPEQFLYGGEIADYNSYLVQTLGRYAERYPSTVIYHLLSNYGTNAEHLFRMMEERDALRAPVSDGSEILSVELAFSARNEMVTHLSDVVLRRTGLGTLGRPSDQALERAGELVGDELGWDSSKRKEQIEQVKRDFSWKYVSP